MTARRLRNRGGWLVCLLAIALWWAVPASGGSVFGEPSGQQGAQKGSQQCGTGQPNPSQPGAKPGSATNAKGKDNGCGPATKPANKPANKPAPLFGGSLSIKRSTQSTDSTALGFNGVDPNGQVQQALLNGSPSSDSLRKVQAMASYQPSAAELAAFEKQGDLAANNTKPGQGR